MYDFSFFCLYGLEFFMLLTCCSTIFWVPLYNWLGMNSAIYSIFLWNFFFLLFCSLVMAGSSPFTVLLCCNVYGNDSLYYCLIMMPTMNFMKMSITYCKSRYQISWTLAKQKKEWNATKLLHWFVLLRIYNDYCITYPNFGLFYIA